MRDLVRGMGALLAVFGVLISLIVMAGLATALVVYLLSLLVP